MKNNNDRDPRNAYWLRGVEGPQVRGRVILELLDLMDKYYQERKWIYTTIPGGQESFDAEISFAMDMIIEELCMDNYIDENKLPLDKIGMILKDEREAKALFEVAEILDYMLGRYSTNKDYLESTYLITLRKKSLEAFKVFMRNEKDNKEFCNFILKIIKEDRDFFDIKFDKNKPPYQSILDYVKKCEEALSFSRK